MCNLLLVFLLTAAAPFQQAEPPPADATAGPVAEQALEDEAQVRELALDLGDRLLEYRSEAGRMVLRQESGEQRAAIFYVYYTVEPDQAHSNRPLTFCFNGGPGSSSVWLHLGAFGPKRVDLGPQGFEASLPVRMIDNPHTLLRHSDLVFLDPVTTGYSRAAKDVDDKDFHGDAKDVESVAEFIRLFLGRKQRWNSAIYLAGESYGTTRAAALSQHLETRHGIYPSGLVLISAILNFQTARFDTGNDLPYALFLPSYAAIAHYHGRLSAQYADIGELLAEVESFAASDYTLALFQGDTLDPALRESIASRLSAYTGLSQQYVLQSNLRIRIDRFVKELRRSEGLTVGRLDGRYTGFDRDDVGEGYEYDPSYAAIQGPYTMALNDYVRRELGFESDLPYEILTGRVHPWSYERAENSYLDVGEDLRGAMTRNPSLRVYVANGLYDLATPYFATRYTFDHLSLPDSLRGNISMGDFAAGHMMYVKSSELELLDRDLEAFYGSIPPK